MSYPRNLDEIPMAELEREIALRRERQTYALCDYCAQPYAAPACKFPERHRAPVPSTVCKGCSYTKVACDQAKTLGAIKCCPDCNHGN